MVCGYRKLAHPRLSLNPVNSLCTRAPTLPIDAPAESSAHDFLHQQGSASNCAISLRSCFATGWARETPRFPFAVGTLRRAVFTNSLVLKGDGYHTHDLRVHASTDTTT
jgi:hypothetical protein